MKAIGLRLAEGHGPGQTCVAYARVKDDYLVATCGADGKATLRDNFLMEPQHSCNSEAAPATVLAVDPKGHLMAVGDDECVKLYKLPSLAFDKVACRVGLRARAVAFSPDGTLLAVGGNDNVIKVVEVKSGTVQRNVQVEDFVLSLAWDPEGQYLAAALGFAGTLLVLDAATGAKDKRIDRFMEKVDYDSLRRHGISWHPDGGQLLAAPLGSEGEVGLLERLSWETVGYLSGEHTAVVNCVCFSPNGLYAATAGMDGRVVVWSVDSAEAVAVASVEGGASASSLAWHPAGNELALASDAGGVGVWTNPVPASMPGPAISAYALEKMQRQNEEKADLKRLADKRAAGQADGAELAGDEEVVLEGGEQLVEEEVVLEGGDGDGDGEAGEEGASPEVSEAAGHAGDSGLAARARGVKQGAVARAGVGTVRTVIRTVVQGPSGPAPQAAFQPCAAPAPGASDSASNRGHFLVFNTIGSVTSRPVQDHHTVEVEFHDMSRFAHSRVPLLTDLYGFTRAALSDKGVLYSSPPVKGPEGSSVPSMVVYRPFESWANNSDWSVGLPEGEDALCLAAGGSFLAVATSRHMLRLFSMAGCQTLVCRLEGPPVALAAHGARLLVVTHSGAPNPHTKAQSLAVSSYDTTTFACLFTQPLPLPHGGRLTWLGFSEEGLPAAADSDGVVCVRTPDYGGRWVPVFDSAAARKGGEVFWPVGLSSSHLTAIVCKPETPHPAVYPRPFFTQLPLAVPALLLDGTAAAVGDLESQALMLATGIASTRARWEAAESTGLVDEASEAQHSLTTVQRSQDVVLLRALRELVRGERHARALEVAAQLNVYTALEGALKVANHHHARALAERISALMTHRQEMAALMEQRQEEAMLAAEEVAAGVAPEGRQQQQQQAFTPIPFAIKRVGSPQGEAQHCEAGGASAHSRQQQQQDPLPEPLGASDTNVSAVVAPAAAAGLLAAGGGAAFRKPTPGSAGLPTPNTLLAAATARPDANNENKRKQPAQLSNPFARKLPKVTK